MGDMADYYRDWDMDDQNNIEYQNNIQKEERQSIIAKHYVDYLYGELLWESQDGTRKPLQVMNHKHIDNCIVHLEKINIQSLKQELYLEIFKIESRKRINLQKYK